MGCRSPGLAELLQADGASPMIWLVACRADPPSTATGAYGPALSVSDTAATEPRRAIVDASEADVVIVGRDRGDHFGSAIGAGPDFDGDGRADLYVGAPFGATEEGGTELGFGVGYSAWVPSSELEIASVVIGSAGRGIGTGDGVGGSAEIVALGDNDSTVYLMTKQLWW